MGIGYLVFRVLMEGAILYDSLISITTDNRPACQVRLHLDVVTGLLLGGELRAGCY